MKFNLPKTHEKYTDKYFLRTKKILEKDEINPMVRYQVFVRKGPGIVAGIEEAIEIIETYSPNFRKNGGKIYALKDGDDYAAGETLMHIDGRKLVFMKKFVALLSYNLIFKQRK